jgi:hypothetical protein
MNWISFVLSNRRASKLAVCWLVEMNCSRQWMLKIRLGAVPVVDV